MISRLMAGVGSCWMYRFDSELMNSLEASSSTRSTTPRTSM
ncbi:MAG: hypothetical protein M5U19_21605 [Microthrixaceae bacterium]|nr:hypothetical protein [Microthrixaceae bacterium]